METKSARLTILIDPVKKQAFDELCASQDLTPSQVIRQLIRQYLDEHHMDYATKVAKRVPQDDRAKSEG
jgi:antitoxin component of RelBE/YafQ-DinJ toxin-antitoxin module